mmetsp:Transcript_18241/g.36718  ORF Transcript_18241/g.36718 Transcript_18241/m.36718 type:complete len:143 (-) Transcript_18241:350-778(-)
MLRPEPTSLAIGAAKSSPGGLHHLAGPRAGHPLILSADHRILDRYLRESSGSGPSGRKFTPQHGIVASRAPLALSFIPLHLSEIMINYFVTPDGSFPRSAAYALQEQRAASAIEQRSIGEAKAAGGKFACLDPTQCVSPLRR